MTRRFPKTKKKNMLVQERKTNNCDTCQKLNGLGICSTPYSVHKILKENSAHRVNNETNEMKVYCLNQAAKCE